MEPCEKCGGTAEDCDPPGWLICTACGHSWWYAIVDPVLPEPTPEEKAYFAETVELIFRLGDGSDRPKRIIELRKASDAFSNRPITWLKQLVDGQTVFSFGTMSRAEASWQIDLASRRGCQLEIRNIK
ncbi:MAG: hypothetical protein JNK90_19370 [Planctomycetaceae bacterium]|nr:hypothetical protein [Planctomycetaceae bacterium]